MIISQTTGFRTQVKSGFLSGVKKGGSSFLWMVKIVLPVSLVVTLLQWTGWLNQISFLLNPLTSLLNLPPEAALPIICGMLINLYAVVAIVTVLPFTAEQMTLIAIFNLIAHGLILEGIVQHKSGFNIIKAAFVRIAAATLTVFVVCQFFGDSSQSIVVPSTLTVHTALPDIIKGWCVNTMGLLLKILGIIMFIMIVLESLKSLQWIDYLLRFFKPLMRILGLAERTTTMWVAATIFGLFYGGAVIVEDAKNGTLKKDELERLHIFVGINHAMLEDPALFAVLGLNAFWLWVPRFIMALIAVQAYNAIKSLKKLLRP